MKKVFVISPWGWAPRMNAQVLRMVNLTRNLPGYGWEAVVFSRKPGKNDFTDEKFRGGKEKIYEYRGILPYIHRLNILLRMAFIPDVFMPDFFLNMRKMLKIVKKERPDVMFSSTPASSLIAAYMLSRKTGIPLVIDCADPWTAPFRVSPPTKLHRDFYESLEKRIIDHSMGVSVVGERQVENLKKAFGNDEKYVSIENGHDRRAFEHHCDKKKDFVTFTFAGTVYGDSDLSFLHIFRELNREKTGRRFRVVFVGNIPESRKNEILRVGDGFVEIRGKVPNREFIRSLVCSDILIFSLGPDYTDAVSSRLPEYMASGRPIIAFMPEDSLPGKIIKKSASGFIFQLPEEKKRAKEFIRSTLDEVPEMRPNMEYISEFEWSNLAGKLAGIMDGAYHE